MSSLKSPWPLLFRVVDSVTNSQRNARTPSQDLPQLDDLDRSIYQWQMWTEGLGEEGQRKLKAAKVLISRIGGLGGIVAYQLAAAGVGKLVLAHAGNIKHSDLNRQLLMTFDRIGSSRVDSAKSRLGELNPRIDIQVIDQNICDRNADALIADVDLVVDCAPLFVERFAMNRAIVSQNKPMVECAMYEFEGSLTTIQPGLTPCLACLSPTAPTAWRREFPVFGCVSGTVGCLAACEVIKLITGLGEPLAGKMLMMDLNNMTFVTRRIYRDPDCAICGSIAQRGVNFDPVI